MATVRISDNVLNELKVFLNPESKYVDVNYTKYVSDAVLEKMNREREVKNSKMKVAGLKKSVGK
ncbi:MAG TPA: hypothetical protein PK079_00725 [Leptospiraceae bacterium]|nr:hypothetical protein [Leptospiraceae bacterium]HMW03965.1 hypothetical protein [Leptospiraceae bacterium]HMX33603.1 hypothetical protein [Leptospiraceae bacterium]HMY29945.1 hypothetical protein [Leptospiraceae bacterium]HMZ66778.1 hypothetical protein [Leptospiraceae bacterium]